MAEKISNMTIHVDGIVTTLEYDYPNSQCYGRTCWTLVDTKEAWKVTYVVYSTNVRLTAK